MIVALAGLPGAGKTTAAGILKEMDFQPLRFGDVTELKLEERGLEINEDNEKYMREFLREEYGMDAYAILNIDRIKQLLPKGNIVIDGLRSWKEYTTLKEEFDDELVLVAIKTEQNTRYRRLSKRSKRGLSREEAIARDKAEIEKLGVAEPIKRADHVIRNDGTEEEFYEALVHCVTKVCVNKTNPD